MWFPGLTFRVMFVLSHLIRTKEFAMVRRRLAMSRARWSARFTGPVIWNLTIGQYRKSIRALERYAGGPDAVYTRLGVRRVDLQ